LTGWSKDEALGKFAEARLAQVVSNLLANAVKFTPSGGRVHVRLTRNDTALELTVADTGDGIDADFLPHIFTPFSQGDASSNRTHGGLGLGLAIARDLVELHGGTIHTESEGRGKGSRFVVRLPLFAPPKSAAEKNQKAGEEARDYRAVEGARILLVEDEPQTREALVKLLSRAGADVIPVTTSADALAAFDERQPDVIISDIGLPGESGYQLLQRIRSAEMEREKPATPAIALTAFAGANDRHQARESGFHKHIAKPVAPAVLLAAVGTLLDERRNAETNGCARFGTVKVERRRHESQ
jgi:CheY-like chemotaxis protein/anti-sigma regulatory factor (Ser/Thr protein kinase)